MLGGIPSPQVCIPPITPVWANLQLFIANAQLFPKKLRIRREMLCILVRKICAQTVIDCNRHNLETHTQIGWEDTLCNDLNLHIAFGVCLSASIFPSIIEKTSYISGTLLMVMNSISTWPLDLRTLFRFSHKWFMANYTNCRYKLT